MSISISLWNADCYREATKCPSLTSYVDIKSKGRTVRNSANQRPCKRVQRLQNSLFSHATLAWENRGRKRCVQISSQFRTYSYNFLTSSSIITIHFTGVAYYQFCLRHRVPSKKPSAITKVINSNKVSWQQDSFFLLFISWKDIEMLFEWLAAQVHQRTAYK